MTGRTVAGLALIASLCIGFTGSVTPEPPSHLGPTDLQYDATSGSLYIAYRFGSRIDILNTNTGEIVQSIALGKGASKIVLDPNQHILYVLQAGKGGRLTAIDVKTHTLVGTLIIGQSPVDLAVTKDHVITCHRFPGEVVFVDRERFQVTHRLFVGREPHAIELVPATGRLYVAHHLPEMRSIADTVAARLSIIDTNSKTVVRSITLPNGSSALRDIHSSPDGRHIFVPHILSRFNLPSTQLERGWMNTNALSVIDAETERHWATVLLDDIDRGAANPWGVYCSADGQNVFVTHAGSHEVSVIDWEGMKHALTDADQTRHTIKTTEDLRFIYDYRKRISVGGKGPRALIQCRDKLIVANYFSDNLSLIDLHTWDLRIHTLGSGPSTPATVGEMYFNDAAMCFQQWQSCASCHPDARADGFNWDLLNDGVGNPKNTKSLLISYETPPVMSLGVRADAMAATRAGFHHIQFFEIPETRAAMVDAYLQSLSPTSSPHQISRLREQRGAALFQKLECNNCHPAPYYTDGKAYAIDLPDTSKWDTPTLLEIWRTAPYWHDGRYGTMREVFAQGKHGLTQHLSKEEIDLLVSFLLTL